MNDIFPYVPGTNGCHKDPVDSRDIPIGAVLGAPGALQSEFDVIQDRLGGQIKIEDQGGSLSCVGQTFAKYKEILDTIDYGKPLDLSAKALYSRIFLARYGGGAFLRDAAALLVSMGVPEEALDPSYMNGNPPNEDYMRQINADPAVLANAGKYKAKGYVTVDNDVNRFKQAIFNGFGMATSSNLTGSGWSGQAVNANGGFVSMPKPGEEVSGHAYLLTGWSDSKQAFRLLNHWSKFWGQGGFAWLRYSDIAWLQGGWTILDIPKELIDAVKNMYNLRRHPSKPSEVYAVAGKTWRHVANIQTLNLGNTEPDRFWIVPAGGPSAIPVATPDEMVGVVEADEIHLDPKD